MTNQTSLKYKIGDIILYAPTHQSGPFGKHWKITPAGCYYYKGESKPSFPFYVGKIVGETENGAYLMVTLSFVMN